MLCFLLGCAEIQVTHLTSDLEPAVGNPWILPKTQFTITLTRHVSDCDSMLGALEVVATPGIVADEDQRYSLLAKGWFASSDIT